MKDDATLQFARIVQIGWVTGPACIDAPTVHKTYYVEPEGFEVTEKATKFHKISNEILTLSGRPLESVLREFMADVKKVCDNGGKIAAHQIEFDAGIIYEELSEQLHNDAKYHHQSHPSTPEAMLNNFSNTA